MKRMDELITKWYCVQDPVGRATVMPIMCDRGDRCACVMFRSQRMAGTLKGYAGAVAYKSKRVAEQDARAHVRAHPGAVVMLTDILARKPDRYTVYKIVDDYRSSWRSD
jgi:hypothetical protein